jgi:hypothetical protein
MPVPLEVVFAPSGDFTDVVMKFVDELHQRWGATTMMTVLIPEFATEHLWQQALHNQSVLVLKGRLLFRAQTVVTSIPYVAPETSIVADDELPAP